MSLEGKDALRYTDFRVSSPSIMVDTPWLRAALRRVLVYGSALVLAVVISGGIFTFTPLVGISVAHTQGISMEPGHKQGDVVIIKRIDGNEARVGDVVVFDFQGMSVMHRVIERYTDASGVPMVVTQGDNVPAPDHAIPASQVSARLVTEVPVVGALSRLIGGEGGVYVYRSLVISASVSFVALWGLVSSVKNARRPLKPVAETEQPETA